MYRIAMVCEGPADRAILEAVLDSYVEDYEPLRVQPPSGVVGGNAGPFGGGWKGVRAWCTSEVRANSAGWSTLLENADLLIIQLDADVVDDDEIDRAKPCPPPADGADEVRALIRQWLDVQALPTQVVLCVPSMASETWALVALLPSHEANVPCQPAPAGAECIECRTDIKSILRRAGQRLKPKLVVGQGGALKNQASGYRKVQGRITAGWDFVLATCSEAARFDTELRDAMTSSRVTVRT